MRQFCAIALVYVLAFASAPVAHGYSCSTSECKLPDCKCPSPSSPLPVDQMPQFVLLTHDDATDAISTTLLTDVTAGLKNPNGCNLPVTFFTMKAQTSCERAQWAWKNGHEIATHTVSHLEMPVGFVGGAGGVRGEILTARDWLVNNCSLPAEDVVGFRSPYLINNPAIREVLFDNNFLYDSTINEHYPMPTSPNGSARLWPYTMDNGIPQDCAWTGNVCTPDESYPGLWEVPVWVAQTDSYPDPAYAMDYCDGTSGICSTLDLMKYTFATSYNGNKAPVPFFIHSPYLNVTKQQQASKQFIQWVVGTYPDAYFVTMHQLIKWIQNPVPKSEVGAWLGCTPGGNVAGSASSGASLPGPVPVPVAASPPAAVAATPPAALPAAMQVTSAGSATQPVPVATTTPTEAASPPASPSPSPAPASSSPSATATTTTILAATLLLALLM